MRPALVLTGIRQTGKTVLARHTFPDHHYVSLDLRDYERFMRALALRGANLLNQTELARDVGVATSTIGQWLSALKAAGVIHLLEPWFNNATKRLVKMPKVYFSDVALAAFLCGTPCTCNCVN